MIIHTAINLHEGETGEVWIYDSQIRAYRLLKIRVEFGVSEEAYSRNKSAIDKELAARNFPPIRLWGE